MIGMATGTALANDEIDALVKLDEEPGTKFFLYGIKPLTLPSEGLPADWKERPLYRNIENQLQLIQYAKQHNKDDAWIKSIFTDIANGCTSDRKIMYSTKCPTFRDYLENRMAQILDMGAFQFSSSETPDSESYGDVTITVTVKLSALTNALVADAEILAADPGLRPILQQLKELEDFVKSLSTPVTGTPIPITTIEEIDTMVKGLTDLMKTLEISI